MTELITIDLAEIKALSKEERQALAFEIHKDHELWNAVNGMGGLSEHSENSLLQGTITNNKEAVVGAKIKIGIKGFEQEETFTNQLGYFKIELKAEHYIIKIYDGRNASDDVMLETEKGVTSTLNFDFKFDGKFKS